jgi:hypothetical protein
MHRLMVTSTAYRQSSDLDPAKAAADPDNVLLGAWRPQRHEGEVVRDSILAVAGKLNEQRYGPPAPVVQNADGTVETKDDSQGNRRSIYLIVRRSQHLTLLDLFDAPMMEINCPERNVSTVPLQALVLLHGPFAERNAAALAERILHSAPGDDAARIRWTYRLLFARERQPSTITCQGNRTAPRPVPRPSAPPGPRRRWCCSTATSSSTSTEKPLAPRGRGAGVRGRTRSPP